MRLNIAKKLALLLYCLTSSLSCAYQFSHLQVMKYPFRSIAVEGIYDTTSEVLPHEIMWSEMQRAFIRDGRLMLTSPDQADALVTLHLKEASLSPAGTIVDLDRSSNGGSIRKDPSVFKGKEPPIFDEIKNLTRAGEVADKQAISASVNVKIWDLHKQTVVLNRDYALSELFMSADNVGDPMNEFLNHEEKLSSDFKRMSQRLASRVLQDFFITN